MSTNNNYKKHNTSSRRQLYYTLGKNSVFDFDPKSKRTIVDQLVKSNLGKADLEKCIDFANFSLGFRVKSNEPIEAAAKRYYYNLYYMTGAIDPAEEIKKMDDHSRETGKELTDKQKKRMYALDKVIPIKNTYNREVADGGRFPKDGDHVKNSKEGYGLLGASLFQPTYDMRNRDLGVNYSLSSDGFKYEDLVDYLGLNEVYKEDELMKKNFYEKLALANNDLINEETTEVSVIDIINNNHVMNSDIMNVECIPDDAPAYLSPNNGLETVLNINKYSNLLPTEAYKILNIPEKTQIERENEVVGNDLDDEEPKGGDRDLDASDKTNADSEADVENDNDVDNDDDNKSDAPTKGKKGGYKKGNRSSKGNYKSPNGGEPSEPVSRHEAEQTPYQINIPPMHMSAGTFGMYLLSQMLSPKRESSRGWGQPYIPPQNLQGGRLGFAEMQQPPQQSGFSAVDTAPPSNAVNQTPVQPPPDPSNGTQVDVEQKPMVFDGNATQVAMNSGDNFRTTPIANAVTTPDTNGATLTELHEAAMQSYGKSPTPMDGDFLETNPAIEQEKLNQLYVDSLDMTEQTLQKTMGVEQGNTPTPPSVPAVGENHLLSPNNNLGMLGEKKYENMQFLPYESDMDFGLKGPTTKTEVTKVGDEPLVKLSKVHNEEELKELGKKADSGSLDNDDLKQAEQRQQSFAKKVRDFIKDPHAREEQLKAIGSNISELFRAAVELGKKAFNTVFKREGASKDNDSTPSADM